MANTNTLIVGGVLLIGGILTIPIVIGLLCAPLGCLVMLIGLVSSNPTPQQKVVYVQQAIPSQYKPPPRFPPPPRY